MRPSVLARVLLVVTALLTLALIVLVVLLELDASYEPADSLTDSLPDIIMTLSFVIVGAVVTIKRPDNLVGWALSLAGLGLLVSGVLGLYGELALFAKPEQELPGGGGAAAVVDGAWTPLMAGVFLLLVVFPSGRASSPRWRTITTVVLGAFAVVWVLVTTAPGKLDPPFEAFENPLAFTDSQSYLAIAWVLIGACLVAIAAAAVSLLRRFRRSRGEERQQFRWFAASAGLLLLTLPFSAIFNWSGIVGAIFGIALIALPISVGIAILRYRLYELDVIIRRTLVYGGLSALLAGLYFAIVLALQQVFSSFAGGSDLAVAVSTLAVAALFGPARRRVQQAVDRRFYRRRYDAQQTLETFAARLRDEVDLDALGTELRTVVRDTMQPSDVSLWLRPAKEKP
jgi:hypothetical protein